MAEKSEAAAVEGEGTETPLWEKHQAAFQSKRPSEFYEPCPEAAAKSIKCMRRNKGDRELCQDYFQAYRDCKKQWMTERKEAALKRRRGS